MEDMRWKPLCLLSASGQILASWAGDWGFFSGGKKEWRRQETQGSKHPIGRVRLTTKKKWLTEV